MGETHVWKTLGGAVRSITNIYSLITPIIQYKGVGELGEGREESEEENIQLLTILEQFATT